MFPTDLLKTLGRRLIFLVLILIALNKTRHNGVSLIGDINIIRYLTKD